MAYAIIDEETNYSEEKNFNKWLKEIGECWGIELGNANKHVFSKSNKGGLQGDGYTYLVVQYKDNTNATKNLKWTEINNDDKNNIKGILDDLEIDKKYRPASNNALMYKKISNEDKDDELYVVYDPSNPKNLYFLESFI